MWACVRRVCVRAHENKMLLFYLLCPITMFYYSHLRCAAGKKSSALAFKMNPFLARTVLALLKNTTNNKRWANFSSSLAFANSIATQFLPSQHLPLLGYIQRWFFCHTFCVTLHQWFAHNSHNSQSVLQHLFPDTFTLQAHLGELIVIIIIKSIFII